MLSSFKGLWLAYVLSLPVVPLYGVSYALMISFFGGSIHCDVGADTDVGEVAAEWTKLSAWCMSWFEASGGSGGPGGPPVSGNCRCDLASALGIDGAGIKSKSV